MSGSRMSQHSLILLAEPTFLINEIVVFVNLLSRVQHFGSPMDCSLQGSSVLRISQARILEWVPISFSMSSSRPRD